MSRSDRQGLDSLPELLHHCKVTANRIVQKRP